MEGFQAMDDMCKVTIPCISKMNLYATVRLGKRRCRRDAPQDLRYPMFDTSCRFSDGHEHL